MKYTTFFAVLAATLRFVGALQVDPGNQASVQQAAAAVAGNLISYYQSGQPGTPAAQVGVFPLATWYWWIAGAIWDSYIDYTAYTGDDKYVGMTQKALAAQVGPNWDFVAPAQATSEANDDQAFWAFAALSAAESSLPPIACTSSACNPSAPYLSAAVNAFNLFTQRWNAASSTCSGGLPWAFNPAGPEGQRHYKNAVTNGAFFQVAARLALLTGNTTYAEWADKVWTWSTRPGGLITNDFHVYDGASDENGQECTVPDKTQWSYNVGVYLHGAAAMAAFHHGADQGWNKAVSGFIDTAAAQFTDPSGLGNATNVLYESGADCERRGACNNDQRIFKGLLARMLAKSAALAPVAAAKAHDILEASAVGAAQACSGGDGATCGTKWWVDGYDGTAASLLTELPALDVLSGLLATKGRRSAVKRTESVVGKPWSG